MTVPGRFELRLLSRRTLAPHVCELRFERVDGARVDFQPGQWLNILIPDADEGIKKAYSIASAPDGGPIVELAVTRVDGGLASMFLHGLQPGDVVTGLGPHGLFTRDPTDPTPALFVATGTGVTPLRSMLLAAITAGSKASMWLLLGVRYEADILYREEFQELADIHPGVRFEVTLSQPPEAWTGRRGYVQEHLPALHAELRAANPEAEPHVYVCGLDRMVTVVRDLSRKTLGIDRKHVHQERYD